VDAALAEPQIMSPERISAPTDIEFAGVDPADFWVYLDPLLEGQPGRWDPAQWRWL